MEFNAPGQKVAGLTGGIASGKTTVARMLADAGARIVDADHVARQVVQKGQPAWQDIVQHFGPTILKPDGQIDREVLGTIVFNDADAKHALNGIVHPHVYKAMQQDIRQLAIDHPHDLVVLDVPLLIESGWHAFLPVVILVYVPQTIQQDRLMHRDGLSAGDAMARIHAQMPIETKRNHADYIIDNTGDRQATRQQVLDIFRQLLIHHPWPS